MFPLCEKGRVLDLMRKGKKRKRTLRLLMNGKNKSICEIVKKEEGIHASFAMEPQNCRRYGHSTCVSSIPYMLSPWTRSTGPGVKRPEGPCSSEMKSMCFGAQLPGVNLSCTTYWLTLGKPQNFVSLILFMSFKTYPSTDITTSLYGNCNFQLLQKPSFLLLPRLELSLRPSECCQSY